MNRHYSTSRSALRTTPHSLAVAAAGRSALLSGNNNDIVIKQMEANIKSDLNDIYPNEPENEPMYTGDGLSHICIDIDAKTELGRKLSHYYESNFEHPVFGHFKTLEGFWRYINCDDGGTKRRDEFRTLTGRGVNKISRTMAKRNVSNFKEIIYEANYHRIMGDKELYELFVNSELPFDYYFIYGDEHIVQRAKGYQWIITMYEDLREMMRKGEKPNKPDYSDLLSVLRNI